MTKKGGLILRRAFYALAILLASALFISAQNQEGDLPNFWDALPNEELAANIIAQMTDEELLAQILMFGWAGEDPSPLVTRWVEERALGSIKVFGWNTDDITKVAQSVHFLQEKAESGRFQIPLFVATDQEGGWIRHIKGKTTETPGNLALGASELPIDAYYTGLYISQELRALGINLNFAPTVDLYTDHDSTVIGPRSFGEDPQKAGILGASFVAGSNKAGVLTTAKHFPGHGDTALDSHGHLPIINIDKKTLMERELVPFKGLIAAGIPAIMSGHLSFPKITGSNIPATFSSYFLIDVLRNEMGFNGLVITDDIMMNGATTYAGSVSRAVMMAIEAGNDIVESSTTPHFNDTLWSGSLSKIKHTPNFRSRVEESAKRVLEAKLAYFKSDSCVPIYPDTSKIYDKVPSPPGKNFFLSQAVRSVTEVRTKKLEIGSLGEKSVLIAGSYSAFHEAAKKRFPNSESAALNFDLRRIARNYDTLIFCLSGKESLRILKNLEGIPTTIIVVSALSPVLLLEVPWVENAIAIYSYAPASFTAAFSYLSGDFTASGHMPVLGIK